MNSKILVVDDSVVVVKTLQMKLGAAGFKVVTAFDGGEALGVVRREAPGLILLDITFPPDVASGGGVAWDGFLLMKWLRRSESTQNTPVIVITGGDPAKYRDRALAEGAIDFFTKPIDHTRLVDVIRQTLHEPAAAA
jgi:two-component system alkaline phosphatase synthesis response regulator PhoP